MTRPSTRTALDALKPYLQHAPLHRVPGRRAAAGPAFVVPPPAPFDVDDRARTSLATAVCYLGNRVVSAAGATGLATARARFFLFLPEAIIEPHRPRPGAGPCDERLHVSSATKSLVWHAAAALPAAVKESSPALRADVCMYILVPGLRRTVRLPSAPPSAPYQAFCLLHRAGVWGADAIVAPRTAATRNGEDAVAAHVLARLPFDRPGACLLIDAAQAVVAWTDAGLSSGHDLGCLIMAEVNLFPLQPAPPTN